MSTPLRLFLDRSTQGRRFVAAVRDLVNDVETIDDRYGGRPAERVPDVRWIADATADGRILVGADRYMLRSQLERRAVRRARALARMIELFTEHLPGIRELTDEPGRLPLACNDA